MSRSVHVHGGKVQRLEHDLRHAHFGLNLPHEIVQGQLSQ